MTTYFQTKEQYLTFRNNWANAVNSKKELTAAHHILYNILRGRSHDMGFTPITNGNKLRNGMLFNFGLYHGMVELERIYKYLTTGKGWGGLYADDFYIPFASSKEEFIALLKTVELPTVKPLESNWARGRTVAQKIIDGEVKPTSFVELNQLYEEAA